MNRKALLTRLTILTTLGFLILGLLPAVQAKAPPFIEELDGANNLANPWFMGHWEQDPITGDFYYVYGNPPFYSTENLFFRVGAARSIQEKEDDTWPGLPWEFRCYLNGKEVELNRFTTKGDPEMVSPPVLFFWYHIFGPDYFTPGELYTLKFEFWVKQPYQGDDLKDWRIYVDYLGIWFPAGEAFSFEYNLNIYQPPT